MTITVTGSKYSSAFLSAVGTTTVTVSSTPFLAADFSASNRIVALFDATGVTFKGIGWVRQYVATNQLQLQSPIIEPTTGATVTQVIGDLVLVSKNFADVVTTGLTITRNNVVLTDIFAIGSTTGAHSAAVFYDEAKQIDSSSTVNGIIVQCGIGLFGRLEDYANKIVSGGCILTSAATNVLTFPYTTSNLMWYGGQVWQASDSLGYINGPNPSYPNTVILNGLQTNCDLVTPNGGGSWGANAARCQLINCESNVAGTNSICERWGDGPSSGNRYRIPRNKTAPLSIFGSDIAGTYTKATAPGSRSVVQDPGGVTRLVRSSGGPVETWNFTNLITTIFNGSGTNITSNFYFSDTYTNLISGSVGVVTLNADSSLVDSVASSSTTWSPSVLRRQYNGTTQNFLRGPWTYSIKKYGYAAVSGAIVSSTYDLGVIGTADNVAFGGAVNQVADGAVTATNTAALAYSSLFTATSGSPGSVTVNANATLDQLYDYLIAWGCSSTALAQFPSLSAYPMTANGTVRTTAMSIVLAAGVTLSAGTKGTSLVTSSTVTLGSGASVACLYTDSTGTRVTATLTGVVVGSTWAILNASTRAIIASGIASASTVTTSYTWTVNVNVLIEVRYYGTLKYLPYETAATLTNTGTTVAVTQILDTNGN
jgi:hypothetical protein